MEACTKAHQSQIGSPGNDAPQLTHFCAIGDMPAWEARIARLIRSIIKNAQYASFYLGLCVTVGTADERAVMLHSVWKLR